MPLPNFKDEANFDNLPRCKHCGDMIEEHAQDGDPPYACLSEYIFTSQQEPTYGGFYGGDPRNFYPEAECCSEKELKAHADACSLANQMQAKGEKLVLDADSCCCRKFGIGVTVYPFDQTYYEPVEYNVELPPTITELETIDESEEL